MTHDFHRVIALLALVGLTGAMFGWPQRDSPLRRLIWRVCVFLEGFATMAFTVPLWAADLCGLACLAALWNGEGWWRKLPALKRRSDKQTRA